MRTVLAAITIALMIGCNIGPGYSAQELPSGKQLKIISVGKMFSSNSDPALILKYQTDLPIADKAALEKEVDEIWPSFQIDVEKAGLTTGVISANEKQVGFIITTSRSQNFVYKKSITGQWSRNGSPLPDLCDEYSNNKEKAAQAIEICTADINSGNFNEGQNKLATRYNNRGIAYGKIGDNDRALADHNKSIELDPSFAKAYNNRGVDYWIKGDNERAIGDFNKAIELDTRYIMAYLGRGNIYIKKGDYDRALADFNKGLELDPKFAPSYVSRGNVNRLRKDHAGALADYNKAVDLDPRLNGAYYNMACLYSADNRTSDACASLEKAITAGYNNWKHIKRDNDLDNIRNDACYKTLMSGK